MVKFSLKLESFLSKKRIKRIVIKIGSNILTDSKGIRIGFIRGLVREVQYLTEQGIEVVVVSSGAIATAMHFLKRASKPVQIPEKQAFAAIGQPVLMSVYAREFAKIERSVGQILITHDAFEHRERYLNAKHSIEALLNMNVVPIINENDSVTIDEIKIGDNDRLSAYVASLVNADLLVILSHVDGLYTANPQNNPNAERIRHVATIDKSIRACVFDQKSETTTGGMYTKLLAAEHCMLLGIPVIITSGFEKNFIKHIFEKDISGTVFHSGKRDSSARKSWISGIRKPKGVLVVDDGAAQALTEKGKSLLPSGIRSVSGQFLVGDCVEIQNQRGVALARGLSNYSAVEVERIMGRKSTEILKILGYSLGDEVIHRDDLVLLSQERS